MRIVKRGIDVVLALLMLVAFAPLIGFVAIAIWVESGTPVIFSCRRFGGGGRAFTMYKFRTMALNAEAALESLGPRNLAQGMVKIADDPRVTPVGRLLRRFSLDELPQLWNVVRGDMSLVGPRPHQLGEVSLEDEVHRQRLSMRPGLTGLWQVRARTNPSLAVRVRYDLAYIARWSLFLDLRIAMETVGVVLRGEGGQIMRPAASPLALGGAGPDAGGIHGQHLVPEVPGGDGPALKARFLERSQHGSPFAIGREDDPRLTGRRQRSTEPPREAFDDVGGAPALIQLVDGRAAIEGWVE